MRARRCLAVGVSAALLAVASAGAPETGPETAAEPDQAEPLGSETEQAAPLEVPRGELPVPAAPEGAPRSERLLAAAQLFAERGYRELPSLSWALLADPRPEAAGLAVELAPRTPGVRFEAGLRSGNPAELARSLEVLAGNLPGLIWLAALAGGALGCGLLLAVVGLVVAGFARTVTLHGHALGHMTIPQAPPAWPGALVAVAALAALPAFGAGPALLLAAAGGIAAMRLRPGEAGVVVAGLIALGLLLAQPVEYWARILAAQTRDPVTLAAWRVERAQPLPGDVELLQEAVLRAPHDLLARYALATAHKHEGRIEEARSALGEIAEPAPAALLAAAHNLRGILYVAEGHLDQGIDSFHAARVAAESAGILFNLSQAHGRALRLTDQATLFAAARNLDPDLVSVHTAMLAPNIHDYLIQVPVPLLVYVRRAAGPGEGAASITREVRRVLLGSRAPSLAWTVLPILGIVGLMMRRTTIQRCARCERAICKRCAPPGGRDGTCVRCTRLFTREGGGDPRMRRREIERHHARRQRAARGLALCALVLPGVPRLYEGRSVSGALRLFLLGSGAALLLAAMAFPGPAEVARLGRLLPLVAGAALLVPLFAWGFAEAGARLVRARSIE